MNSNGKKIKDLPASEDEYWGDSEKYVFDPVKVNICKTHTKKNWMRHKKYIDNKDGTISCELCPWGTRVPGYIKVSDGEIVDLRNFVGG